jgi:hypothetical protein
MVDGGVETGAAVAAALETGEAGGVGIAATGEVVAAPAEASPPATGIWSPPRAATNEIAMTAQAAANNAEARTAGVIVRRLPVVLDPSTCLP